MITQLIERAQPHWQHYIEHQFVRQLAQGTLAKRCFQHYLKQDYRYLFHYSRAFALGIFKAKNFAEMAVPRKTLDILSQEIQLHINYCKQWGISEQEMINTPESPACVAYTRYLLDVGMTGGLAELYAAITPCAVGYAQAAYYITTHYPRLPNNPYQSWIDVYSSADFQQAAAETADFLTSLCQSLNPTQFTHIQNIFTTATRMEINFWQMGLDLS
ncbi:thiaminase II [Rodentibacter caecimuris]|uniref:Aminopyrimidine aminohydrolase n=1 Tax=Rodentibacter caecimuris TaxID=1796644 RepID=A0AAJ3K6U7_9PAST|nr:thiaminase II [Rodentibacter heylii]AOF52138.1 Thiaminase II involved in salvage of thiamin pyrimidine moiety [Pasteurellaceae bacterium NI1060]OOF73270.1 thiaminase II [Rodentibacter heylii]OOF74644.1 thiaminase II [Rodentibacter heylii]OOF77989.1 thiaminase II [Rodentibacter heylii]